MAEIQKREIIQRIINGLRVEGGTENVPTITEDKIRVVFVANEVADIKVIQDDSLNLSNKTITVPTGKKWRVMSVFADFTATATIGSRRISVQFRTPNDDVFFEAQAGSNITASQNRIIVLSSGTNTHAANIIFHIPMGENIWLDENMNIRVRDINNVDAAADDMLVRVHIQEFSREG